MNQQIETYLHAVTDDKVLTPEQIAYKVKRIRQFQQAFHDLEESLLLYSEPVTESRLANLKKEFTTAHAELVALFGSKNINQLPGHLYEGLPLHTMDREEYQRRLDIADQELQAATLSFEAVRDSKTDEARLRRAEIRYLETVARIKSGVHHFLQTVTPIDAFAFNLKRNALLDKKTAAMKELRMLQIQGVDIGQVL